MNNPNVTNPYGTQTVTFDPVTGQPNIVQTLSPEQQALLTTSQRTQGLLGQIGGQGAESLKGIVGTPVDFSTSPAAPVPGQVNQAIVNAMMQRPMADYQRAVEQNKSDLAAAGIPVGSKAYNTQQELLGRQLTDAQTQAELAGVQAGQTAFNQGTAARAAANQENLTARQTPINEITALLSGSQVSNPFQVPTFNATSQVAPAPVFGATTAAGNYASDIYNAQQAAQSGLMSGLFGLGGSGLTAYGLMNMGPAAAASDRRLKRNIQRIGTHPLGIGLYRYDIFGRQKVGVMADEVLTVKPEAVIRRYSGYLMVDYARL
jgi:hypothetical protein